MIMKPYCNRKTCFANIMEGGFSCCKCLTNTEDKENCKFFKTKERFDEESELYAKAVTRPVKILRTISGMMYY